MIDKERGISLIEVAENYNPNVSFFKFLAAILVVIAHAFPLAGGSDCRDLLGKVTDGELNFGAIAVGFFFLIGGFYITRSILHFKSAKRYFMVRIIRIFPGLVMVIICSLILGSFLSTYSWKEYWHFSESWSYLWNCLLILHHDLPGVFQNNAYTSTVNGSLWTLPVEWMGYIGCYIFYKVNLLSHYFWVSFLLVLLVMVAGYPYLSANIVLRTTFRAGLLFYIGMGFYVYRAKIILTRKWNWIVWIVFLLLLFLKQGNLAMVMAFPYLMMYLIFATPSCSKGFAKLGNLSYGIYLCAFPIQQTIAMFSGSPYINLFFSIPLSIMFGGVIYWCTERLQKFVKIK